MEQNFSAKLKSEKGFFIGDVCYALADTDYYGEWNNNFENFIGVHEIRGIKFAVAAVDVDGEYGDNEGHHYGVDAGNIAIVPLELCNKYSLEKLIELGCVVAINEAEVEVTTEDIAIDLGKNRVVLIDTGYGETEYEDEEDYECDEYDEEYEDDDD